MIPFLNYNPQNGIPEKALKLSLSNINWKEFPYKPEVNVTLWHDGETLFLNFEVEEDYVAALAQHDNEKVSKDSCVELFITFGQEGYYNLEANCIGTILMSHRKSRKEDVIYASPEILSKIKRLPSLGGKSFDCMSQQGKWELLLAIPADVFFLDQISSFQGLKAKCNIYKCGDNLPVPHYLSWKPILTESPDFHRPEFFADIEFE